MNELSQHDRKLLNNLFQMIGFCKAQTGLVFRTPDVVADNKYLGRIIENLQVQIGQMEAELDRFSKEWGK